MSTPNDILTRAWMQCADAHGKDKHYDSMTSNGPKIDLFEAAVDLVVNAINIIITTKT